MCQIIKEITDIDRIDTTGPPPEDEPRRQYYYMAKCRRKVEALAEEYGHVLRACVTTFGCQMNARDSEKLVGILKAIGYEITDSEDGDLVLYNTCTVRDNANQKVYGRLGYLKVRQQKNPRMLIGLCGCMMQEPSVLEKLRKSYGFVNLIFGTHNVFKLAELLYQVLDGGEQVIDLWDSTDQIVETLPVQRKYPFKSGVNIMFGCNNFCSYCIVPYVRGRERSRAPEDILEEIRRLVSDGVSEVMLLGQNVNSYGKNLEEPVSFAQLLTQVEAVDGLERIRFMTSHPKDLSRELIDVMAGSEKICRHLHLPLQSGSSRILKLMNRRYTKEQYLELVDRIRTAMPDIALTTDIIVGFPGETEEDFLETLDVAERVQFDNAFTFLYSRRTGTPAAVMADQVPEDVMHERFDRLLALVQRCAGERAKRLVGKTCKVLVETVNPQDASLVTGRLDNNSIVHFPGDSSMIGKIVTVTLRESKGFYYMGERSR